MLTRELAIKNTQITQQSEIIAKQLELVNGLSERVREGNILIGSLQQRLALSDGRDAKPSEPVDARPAPAPRPEKGTGASKKAAKSKRGFFSRLFH